MAYNSTSWLTGGTTSTLSSTEVLVQYENFGIGSSDLGFSVANRHYLLPFNGVSIGSSSNEDNLYLGTGTDPDTSLTLDDNSELLPTRMWYIPDNIYIDAIYSIEGADAATGDTTKFHCMSYTFTSGSTSCLTSGTLIAHSDDETNAGSEQVYLNTWNMDSNTVAAGKVLICTFEPVSVNSDYAYTVTIKYHLV